MQSIVQRWVMDMPLRHQGVLLGAVRGCDGVSKRDVTKTLVSALRGYFMTPHDPREVEVPGSYMHVSTHLQEAMAEFARRHDHYPLHFVLHLIHAAQVMGYKHPDIITKALWSGFYEKMVRKFHMRPENEADMDARLTEDRVAKDTVIEGCSSNDWEPSADGDTVT